MIYYVYWDCDTQVELFRGTLEECSSDDLDCLGGGNYCVYPCLKDYHITKVIGRDSQNKLQILTEED